MKFFKAFSPIILVFMLIAVGFFFAHWKRISLTEAGMKRAILMFVILTLETLDSINHSL